MRPRSRIMGCIGALGAVAALAIAAPAGAVTGTDTTTVGATVNGYVAIDAPASIDFGNVDVNSTVERTGNVLEVHSNLPSTALTVSRTAFGSTLGPTDFALEIKSLDVASYTDIPVGTQLTLNPALYYFNGNVVFDLRLLVPYAAAGPYSSTVTFTATAT